MSLEETDTSNSYEKIPLPDGEQTFKIIEVTRVEKVKGLYEWALQAEDGEKYQQNMFANEMGPLLRLLGCKEVSKDKFSWDTVMVEGRSFTATVSHVPDKKDASVIRQKMANFKASAKDTGTPF
jgi:hypothetical protein